MVRAKRFKGLAIVLAALAVLAGMVPQTALAANWYVDNALGEVKPEEKVRPAQPRPVQVLFEFQRNGVPNAGATKQIKPWMLAAIKASGAFTDVVETPVPDGAVLSIRMNIVIDQQELDRAKREGFRAGLGFGLFGGVVATDHYVISFDYVPTTGVAPIKTSVEHALHMKYGNKDVQIDGTQAKNPKEALQTIVRQAVDRGVNNIVADTAFPK
jgi:hypothetical protein